MSKAFTLLEMLITMGIISMLTGLSTLLFLSPQRRTDLTTTLDVLVSDLRDQQLKSMISDTEGRSVPDSYGIYFSSGSYTLFHGSAYNPNSPDNFTVNLAPSLSFSQVSYSGSTVIFSRGSGETGSLGPDQLVVLSDEEEGLAKSLYINTYGVITEIN